MLAIQVYQWLERRLLSWDRGRSLQLHRQTRESCGPKKSRRREVQEARIQGSHHVQQVRFSDSSGEGGKDVEFMTLPPTPATVDQTSLHSFMIAKPGTKSRVPGGGEIRRARLVHVSDMQARRAELGSGHRKDRSRSPIPHSSDEEASAGDRDSSNSSFGEAPPQLGNSQGFGAATSSPLPT